MTQEITLDNVTPEQVAEIVNMYHLARTALSGKNDSTYDRKIWASAEFSKLHGISQNRAYKILDRALA